MAVIIYSIFLFLYRTGISIASLWNTKAKLWLSGRKDIFILLNEAVKNNAGKLVWMHCSSLGEFEQGRPLFEKLKSRYPQARFLLTFFSPSGYEIRKNYAPADYIFYLPLDSGPNAKKFLDITNPSLVLFVKYDYWYHYIHECRQRNIPLLMISAVFREEQAFFKWYGSLHRKMCRSFSHFFVQDERSGQLLKSLEQKNITVAGDTRFDRVAEIAEKSGPLPLVEKFCEGNKIIIAGSTWPEDEKIIKEAMDSTGDLKLIIAPHEIHEKHLEELKSLFPDSIFYSQLSEKFLENPTHDNNRVTTLIIDNIGLLAILYRYATITYVGGGFNSGIHNTIEAAVYGKPVLFGPKYRKFREAIDLVECGGGISIRDSRDLKYTIEKLLRDEEYRQVKSKSSYDYVKKNRGATEKILNYIQENRLLTN